MICHLFPFIPNKAKGYMSDQRNKHTPEFEEKVEMVRDMLARFSGGGEEPRFGAIVDGLREGIHNQQMLRAARIMFEDYGPVRVCVRVMMRLLVRRMRGS